MVGDVLFYAAWTLDPYPTRVAHLNINNTQPHTMRTAKIIAPVLAFASSTLAASSYGPGYYWNSSTPCTVHSTTTHHTTSTLTYSYDDITAAPIYTDIEEEKATTTQYVTLTSTLSSCDALNGTTSCSTWTTKELEYSYTTTKSGKVELITSIVPFPTSTSDPTTTETVTPGATVYLTEYDCDASSCSSWTTSELVEVYTTTHSGKVSLITSLVPFPTTSALESSSVVTENVYVTETVTSKSCDGSVCTGAADPVAASTASEASKASTTKTATADITSTATVTFTKCNDHGSCSTWTTEKLISSSTVTGKAHETVLTSIVPNSPASADPDSTVTVTPTTTADLASSSSADVTTTLTTQKHSPSMTTVTVRHCSDNKCTLETKTSSLSTVTTSSEGTVTVYTTYCPYSGTVAVVSQETVSQVVSGTPVLSTSVYTSTVSDVPVVLTSYHTAKTSSLATIYTYSASSTASNYTVPAVSTAENDASSLKMASGVFGLLFGLAFLI